MTLHRWVRCASIVAVGLFALVTAGHAALAQTTGPTGATGPQGATGPEGPAGPTGATGAAAAGPGDHGQTAEESTPKLVAAQTSIRIDIEEGLFEARDTSGTATGDILVTNTGTAAATGIDLSAFFSDGEELTVETSVPDIARNETVPIEMSLPWSAGDRESGTLLFEPDIGPPLTVPFTIRQTVNGSGFGWSAAIAAAIALGLTLTAWARLKVVPHGVPGASSKSRPPLSYLIYPGASWSFSGSWATSLTAVGAILGLVLAASGFVGDVLPGLATGLFAGVNIGYLLLVALAAVVYKGSYNAEGKPTYLALLLAAFITLWAVTGELITIAPLIVRGGVPMLGVAIPLIVVLFVLYLYVKVSTLEVLLEEKPTPVPPPVVIVIGEGSDNTGAQIADAMLGLPESRALDTQPRPTALL